MSELPLALLTVLFVFFFSISNHLFEKESGPKQHGFIINVTFTLSFSNKFFYKKRPQTARFYYKCYFSCKKLPYVTKH